MALYCQETASSLLKYALIRSRIFLATFVVRCPPYFSKSRRSPISDLHRPGIILPVSLFSSSMDPMNHHPYPLRSFTYRTEQVRADEVQRVTFVDPCIVVKFINKNPTRCNNVSKFYYSIFI